MKTKKQWEQQRNEASNALWDIEAEEKAQKSASLLGKCFRHHNSYNGDNRWWLYARVINIGDRGWPVVFKFQTTSNDEIRIEPAELAISLDGYTPITEMEFCEAWLDLQRRIASLTTDPAFSKPPDS